MYFQRQDIQKNVNFQYGIDNIVQNNLMNGNAEFMILLGRQMKTSYTIPSLALHLSQIFFQKKCYLFYDRFVILTASFVLASKIKDIECRLKGVCNAFYNIICRMTMNFEPFNEDKMKKIHDEICIAETEILRALEYKVDFVTPHEYLKKYVESLSQNKEAVKKVFNHSRIIIMDSYRTKCCLLFNPLVICVAALMISCRYEGFRPYNDKLVDEKEKEAFTHEELYEFWICSVAEGEEESLRQEDILECITMMNELLILGIQNQMSLQIE